MAQKSEGMPGWFPFALTASFLVMLAAGVKSGWRLAGSAPPPPPPQPTPPASAPVQQAGVIHGIGDAAQWRYFYVWAEPMRRPAQNKTLARRGPVLLDDAATWVELAQWRRSLESHEWPRAMRDEYGHGNVYTARVSQYDWTGTEWRLARTV
jgi:hypothetical protein